MLCPNCKREIDDDSRFCRHCGVEFIGEESALSIRPEADDVSGSASAAQTIHNAPTQGSPFSKTPKNKKTLAIQLLTTLAVLLVICGVLLTIGLSTGRIGKSGEVVTDAEGERIRSGRGEVEMAVRDVDGSTRQITSDKSLVTPSAILKEYTSVMNQLKTDAPAFTSTRYQNLPTDKQNLGAVANLVLPIIERYVTSKDAADPVSYPAGNADKLPLANSSNGCLLTDETKLKNAYCEILGDETYRLVLTLTDETNPTVLSPGATYSQSAISGIFEPYDHADQISAIADLALSNIDFTYTNCTAELVYNHKTQQVQSLRLTMYVDVTADAYITRLTAEIVDVTEYTDFTY